MIKLPELPKIYLFTVITIILLSFIQIIAQIYINRSRKKIKESKNIGL